MKSSLIFLIVLFAVQFITAQNIPETSTNSTFSSTTQGGVLKFTDSFVERFIGSQQNSAQIVLTNYTGFPLKALQFKIIVGRGGGNLILTSVERGSGIPASEFLFDYEICKGLIGTNGSSIDTVKVVFLGNGTNALLPEQIHHIITIIYEVANSQNTSLITRLSLDEVTGATSTPVQNANVTAGEDEIIYLLTSSAKNDKDITLLQNYPNPFNPNTTINFVLNKDEHINLKIFNSIGQEVATVLNEFRTAGNYEIIYDASNLTSGIYLYQIKTSSFVQTRKMILMR